MKWQSWSDAKLKQGWAYRLGHQAAHFLVPLHFANPDVMLSACGQVIMDPEHQAIFVADHGIKKCGRCSRSVNKQPELLGPGAVAGFWSFAMGMTSQHHWLVDEAGFKSRCGKTRKAKAVAIVEPEILADMEVSQGLDLPHCKKCSNYLGVDMAKNLPGKQVIKDAQGDLITVELVQAQLTQDQLAKVVQGGRILAEPVEVWVLVDDRLVPLPAAADPYDHQADWHHPKYSKLKVVIIDEVQHG